MLEKLSQFLSSEQPCESKSSHDAYVALQIAGVKKKTRSDCGRSTLEAIGFEFPIKDMLGKLVFSVIGECQISLQWCRRHIIS